MTRFDADVLVVGLGPIGAYAAWRFASRGLRVVGIEAAPAEKNPSDIGAFHFERVAFDRAELPLPPADQVICTYDGITVHSPVTGRRVWVGGVDTWALDLNWFIEDLRGRAVQAGADLRYGARVTGVLREENRIAGVAVESGGDRRELRAVVTVDATGLARAVRRHVPSMQVVRGDATFSVYMEYWTRADTEPEDGIHSYAGPNAWTAGYPGYTIVGIGRPLPLSATKAAHAEWVRAHFPGETTVQRSVSGVIPYAPAPPTFVDDGVVVLGDAAATNKPFNGEGIASGMALVRAAAEHLPEAVKAGGTRRSLWPINRAYFEGQGAKFAFLYAAGCGLLSLPETDLDAAFAAGLISGEDMRQTFLDYEVRRPAYQWIAPVLRLAASRPGALATYVRVLARAARFKKLAETYPDADAFDIWRARYDRLARETAPA